MSSKILLTGGTGYLGSHFLEITNNPNIICISSKNNKNFIKCDLINNQDIKNLSNSYNFKKIINLAGFVPKNIEEYDSEINETNKIITENIISNFHCDLFHFSTQAIYENNKVKIIKDNTKINKPSSKYSITKLNAEKNIYKRYRGKHIVIRLPGVFGGKRSNGIIYNFINYIIKNNSINFKINKPKIWSTMYYKDINLLLNKIVKMRIKKNNSINYNYYKQPSMEEVINYISNRILKKNYITFSKKNNYYFLQDNRINTLGKINSSLNLRLNEYIKYLNVK